MNDEISQEAKQALADNARRKAIDRLERDGAHSNAAVQRRVLALAAERNIPPADYAKLMHKRIITEAVLAFCKKYNVSIDWLMCGDLKGLQRMTLERKLCSPPAPTADRIMQKYRNLSPVQQAIVDEAIDQLLEKQK
jgi:hypothetical protein